jgi:pimeloyl-ACP methyl ester carboxylesterase
MWVMTRPWQEPPDPTPADGPDPYGDPDPEWLRIDWRQHLRTVELARSTRVNYVELGSGPPLLFLHGLGGCWQNWLENIPHFARTHRVLAPDLPGFGASPMPSWRLSIRSYGQLLLDFCETLGTGPLAVVGNSMGGFISAELSVASRALVSKLVLVSAAGVSHARMYVAPAATFARMGAAMSPLAFRYHERALRRPGLRHRVLRNLFYKPAALPQELVWEFVRGGLSAPGLVAAVRGLANYDILDRLRAADDPALIVWGRNDMVVPAADGLAFAEALPNSRLEIFDRCGHIPMAERPVRFNRLLERFLAE